MSRSPYERVSQFDEDEGGGLRKGDEAMFQFYEDRRYCFYGSVIDTRTDRVK